MSGVLYRKAGEAWTSPTESGYVSEDHLQAIIDEFPELLPGVSPDSYVCREFSTDSGPIDNLIINAKDGSLTLVECKLAKNPEVRRKILGQIIDYAASLSRLDFDEFHQRWKDRGGVDLTAIETAKGPLSLAVSSNLETARFTLLLAVDEINEPLKDMVIYFNRKTDATTRVALIELARHSTGDTEIIIPQTFGYEALKPQVDAYEQRNPWTKDDFAAWLLANEPSSLSKFEDLMKVMEDAGHQWGGTKAETPSGAICVRTSNGFRYPLVFHSYDVATIEARFVDFKKDSFVDELVSFFENIEGVNTAAIRANNYGAKPKIAVSRFGDPRIEASLLALCERVSKS
jgi:hypothetical protein